MQGLVRFSLKQIVFINVTFVLLMVIGAYAFLSLPVERYPNIKFGKAVIETYFPGASPRDVEALVTREIEDALEDLENLEYIRSTSYRQRSSILIKFIDDVDYNKAFDEVRLKVLSIMGELPETVDPPRFTLIDVGDWLPVVSVNLVGERNNRVLSLLGKDLKTPFKKLPGVKEVKLQGEYTQEFHVYLNPEKLTLFGVTYDQVAEALKRTNVNIPAGDFANSDGESIILVDEQFRTREQVMETIIRTDVDGSFLRVKDVADEAELSYRDPFVITSVNGTDCVTLQIIKTSDGNAISIFEDVQEVVESFKPLLDKEGIKVVYTQDSTEIIADSMRTLGMNMALGIVLVCLLIYLFMGLRNAALTTIGIPFAFLVTMIIMYLTGNSLNEITLFSFVLVSGIIVDDAIVVVENIYRHLQNGVPLRKAVIEGTSEVFLPVVSATLTTICAFLPMLIMTGSTGEFFSLIPKAVAFALAASLIECLLILPSHYIDYGPREVGGVEKDIVGPLMIWFGNLTQKIIKFVLRFRWASLGVLTLLFFAAIVIVGLSISGKAPLIRIQFFPDDYSLYYVEVEGPSGTSIEQTSELIKKISLAISEHGPGMTQSAAGFAGFTLNDDYQQVFGANRGNVAVALPVQSVRHFNDYPTNDPLAHLDWVNAQLKPLILPTGFTYTIHAQKDGPPTGKDVNISILGANEASVQKLASDVLNFIKTDPRLKDELTDREDNKGRPSRIYQFRVNHERAAEYGVSPLQVGAMSASLLEGRIVGQYRLADEDIDLKLKIAPAYMQHPEDALNVPVIEHPAGPVKLHNLAYIENYSEQASLERFHGTRAINVMANIRTGAKVSPQMVATMVNEYYRKNADRYPGAIVSFGGEFEDTKRSFTSLMYAFLIAVLLIYIILATQFQSYMQPVIILSAIVFSLVGVIFGKLVTQSLFTVNSFIAIVGVTGVVVNDSLVLVDFLNKLYRSGKTRYQAVMEGTRVRLRPILLTTLTTTLGLLPMALGIPSYSLVWGTMASTFVTGLCTATFLTIVIIPVEWDLLEEFKSRRARRKKGKLAEAA